MHVEIIRKLLSKTWSFSTLYCSNNVKIESKPRRFERKPCVVVKTFATSKFWLCTACIISVSTLRNLYKDQGTKHSDYIYAHCQH